MIEVYMQACSLMRDYYTQEVTRLSSGGSALCVLRRGAAA